MKRFLFGWIVFLLIGNEANLDFRRFPRGQIQLPKAEIFFVDDGLPVAG